MNRGGFGDRVSKTLGVEKMPRKIPAGLVDRFGVHDRSGLNQRSNSLSTEPLRIDRYARPAAKTGAVTAIPAT